MSVIVYQMAHSPFCIPVTRALAAAGVPFETVEVPNWDRTEIISRTGGKSYEVPLLLDGDKIVHEASADSQTIAHYIDEKFGKGRLFPASTAGLQDIVIRYLENEVESVTFKLVDPAYIEAVPDLSARVMVIRHKERKFGRGCVESWRNDRRVLEVEAEKALCPFEEMLKHKQFLLGQEPVYCDFLLYGILGNLTYRDWNEIPRSLVHLRAWYQIMADWKY